MEFTSGFSVTGISTMPDMTSVKKREKKSRRKEGEDEEAFEMMTHSSWNVFTLPLIKIELPNVLNGYLLSLTNNIP